MIAWKGEKRVMCLDGLALRKGKVPVKDLWGGLLLEQHRQAQLALPKGIPLQDALQLLLRGGRQRSLFLRLGTALCCQGTKHAQEQEEEESRREAHVSFLSSADTVTAYFAMR